MNCKTWLALLGFMLCVCFTYAQRTTLTGEVEATALYGTDEELPFWTYTNTFGRMEKTTNTMALASVKVNHILDRWAILEAGAGIMGAEGGDPSVRADHYYIRYQNFWFGVEAGKTQPKENYDGIATVNTNFIWTNNARPMPGLRFYTREPLPLDKDERLWIEADWADYVMDDDRGVKNTRVHSKSVNFIYNVNYENTIELGLQHVVQWDGGWPVKGSFGKGFLDYTSAVMGKDRIGRWGSKSETQGDWNQMGLIIMKYRKSWRDTSLEFFYNYYLEQVNSIGQNFPDGRYGIYLKNLDDRHSFWRSFIYEFYYTKSQGYNGTSGDKADNYFNHSPFTSGWTFHNRVVGNPFFTEDPNGNGIINNHIMVHHFGMAGKFGEFPFKAVMSYRKNYGLQGEPYTGPANVLSGGFDMLFQNDFVPIHLLITADYAKENKNAAIGVRLQKQF
ncbi:capsule assembly Wzi family protein [Robertkochia solimangrovi]|uniref:capsule assembly Wzi family protein n=1 Tax=Robertkochia solimangrovi TaxID=2213046 RepID=UPI00117EA024|nr:capsule assembly Wzi family protein [Robertkochia solimangrovi]TRZ44448.1 hypothetical protein DMZ48_08055 [Robertkochia solimangrovi]